MGCIYQNNWTFGGTEPDCQHYEEGSDMNPEGCDENGFCIASDDPDPSWCQSYEYNRDGSHPEEEEDEDVCDWCGEPLGFCAIDCESREEDFDE